MRSKSLARSVLVCCLALPGLSGALAATLGEASATLSRDIQSAQKALAASESRVNRERGVLAKKLNALESEVGQLRERNAAASRAADERDLTLSNLRERLDQWREQSDYQRHLVASYLSRHPENTGGGAGAALGDQLGTLRQQVDSLAEGIFPGWSNEDIALDNGELVAASTIAIGPVAWYLRPELHSAGLLVKKPGAPAVASRALNTDAAAALEQLYRQDYGFITLAPGLDQALAGDGPSASLLAHIRRGGIWVAPILALGLAALLVVAGKLVQFRRLNTAGGRGESGLSAMLDNTGNDPDETDLRASRQATGGVSGDLLDATLNTPAGALRDDLLFAGINRHRRRLESWLGALSVIAAVAPLLGLLGTVSGMIETFQLMTVFGAGDPEAVSSGISKALITTELGLVVAIPTLLLHTLLSRWSRVRLARVEDIAVALSRWQAGQA
ncbi:MAG: MotA/TolQ/ExbB proton channel family protein [Parahaliea sp.]